MTNESFNFQISLILKGVKCLLEVDNIDNEESSILEKVLAMDTNLSHLIIRRVENPNLIIRAIEKNFKLIYVRINNMDKNTINMYINRNINYSICKESLILFTNLSNIPLELNDLVYNQTQRLCYHKIPTDYNFVKY
jgi:hypothetical protein